MPACTPATAPGITAVAQMTRAPAATASANIAASAAFDCRAPGSSPRHSSQTSSSGNAAHSSLASSASGEPRDRDPGTPFEPLPERAKTEEARQHDAARPDVIDRFGLNRVQGEEHARDQRRALRQQAAQALPGQQHRAQVKQQVEEVIAQRIARAQLSIHPEREIGERTRLERRPDFDPAARRIQGGVGENGIIVKVKTRTERSAKGEQRGSEQKKTRSHDQIRAYVKRPKTAAERKARIAEILSRLDRMYPGRDLRPAASQPVGTAGGHHSFRAMHRQARE